MRKINFNDKELKEFKLLYQKSKKEGRDVFRFKNHEFYQGYAKYLIEFLTEKHKTHEVNRRGK